MGSRVCQAWHSANRGEPLPWKTHDLCTNVAGTSR
jgi:hypothetical protein